MAAIDHFARVFLPAVKRQAKRAIESARYVLIIDEKGDVKESIANDKSKMDLIVVVGPTKIEDTLIEQAILLEIGIFRSPPYKNIYGPILKGGKRKLIAKRRFEPQLSLEQLRGVFPKLQEIMVAHMKSHTEKWQFKTFNLPFYTPGNRDKDMARARGVRFMVSIKDPLMFSAVLRSELTDCRLVPFERDIGAFLHRVFPVLRKYRRQDPTDKQLRFMSTYPRLEKVHELFEERNHLPHQLHYMLEQTKRARGAILFKRILEHRGVDFDEVDLWGARFNDDRVPTFDGVGVWCVPRKWTPKTYRSKRFGRRMPTKRRPDYISFELYDLEDVPKKKSPVEVYLESLSEEDDIPFPALDDKTSVIDPDDDCPF